MALTPDELDRIAARTLAHYDEQALSYWNGTRDHDVSQNVDALLRHIEARPPFELLDFGCEIFEVGHWSSSPFSARRCR